MSPSQLFDIWAPPSALWSRWAKPVPFAELEPRPPLPVDVSPMPHLAALVRSDTALVIDLPSSESVQAGLTLARQGWQPVPLFNGARGPGFTAGSTGALLDNSGIIAWLCAGASLLPQLNLPPTAPPAFLLDARRKASSGRAAPGQFDNRWVVFPQDFPSANFLKAHGIAQAMLLQSSAELRPQEDLAHVLLRWQEGGVVLSVASPDQARSPAPLLVTRPSRFRSLWYCALTLAGLRRNSAGGFGSIVPHPASSSG